MWTTYKLHMSDAPCGTTSPLKTHCWYMSNHSYHHKGTFTHARADAWKLASTQIITHVHTCAVAEREQNPLRKKWVQHPICRVRFETARSKPSLSSRNGRSALVRSASAPRMCKHIHGSGAGMSKSARLRHATAPRMCERSFRPWHCTQHLQMHFHIR